MESLNNALAVYDYKTEDFLFHDIPLSQMLKIFYLFILPIYKLKGLGYYYQYKKIDLQIKCILNMISNKLKPKKRAMNWLLRRWVHQFNARGVREFGDLMA